MNLTLWSSGLRWASRIEILRFEFRCGYDISRLRNTLVSHCCWLTLYFCTRSYRYRCHEECSLSQDKCSLSHDKCSLSHDEYSLSHDECSLSLSDNTTVWKQEETDVFGISFHTNINKFHIDIHLLIIFLSSLIIGRAPASGNVRRDAGNV